MLLQSISVRNYRVLKDLTVDLDPSRNLIGGQNASGKSTLIEAIHRALFLKASTGGALQKGMVSTTHSGHPEVDVTFETRGKTYQLSKRFSGASGTATLTCQGEATLQGAEAEDKLAELLGIENRGGGRMTPTVLAGRWAHLWVWQGHSGADPSGHASQERDSLLARLKNQGGAVAMQSELDGRVSGKFADMFSDYYTDGGKPRAGSPLEKAIKDRDSAEVALASAQQSWDHLQTSVATFEHASRTIEECEKQLAHFSIQRKEAQDVLSKTDQLLNQANLDRSDFARKEKEYQDLLESDSVIADLRAKISEQEQTSAEQSALGKELEEQAESKREQFARATKEARSLDEALREAGNRCDLAAAFLNQKELTERQRVLRKKIAEISQLESRVKEKEIELAKLPQIDVTVLAELQKLSFAVTEAETALNAMATEIEVLKTDQTISLGKNKLAKGESTVIDETAEIQIGEGTRLRVTPGGGSSLDEARSHETACLRDFQEKLDRLGVASLDEAQKHSTARQKLDLERQSLQSELSGKESDSVEEENARITIELETAKSEIARRKKMIAQNLTEPEDVAKARDKLAKEKERLQQAETECEAAGNRKTALETATETAQEQLARHRRSFEEEKQRLTELQTQWKVREEASGNEKERTEKLKLLKGARDEAEKNLKATESSLAQMQPEKRREDLGRLDRAARQQEQLMVKAREDRAVAGENLRSDGSLDLRESLKKAEAQLNFARERFQGIERKAEAIKKLKEMFAEEQHLLADQFTAPLVKSISSYLAYIFGPGASAAMELKDGQFQGLKLIHDGGTFDFDSLSGGTREQVSAAVRLAVAEILLEDNDGKLPIVFDDAFNHSDDERALSLQRMLDCGARKGLQIILLSWHPGRFAGFGAKMVNLGN